MDARELIPTADEARRIRWNADHLIHALEHVPYGSTVRIAIPDAQCPDIYEDQVPMAVCRPEYVPGGSPRSSAPRPARVITITTEKNPGIYSRTRDGLQELYYHDVKVMNATDLLRQLKRLTFDQRDPARGQWPITVNAPEEPNGSVAEEFFVNDVLIEITNNGAVVTITTESEPWEFGTEYYPPLPDPAKPRKPK